jgi:hypothetical protein
MKHGFQFWMLKPKSIQSSECTNIYQTKLNTFKQTLLACQLMTTSFLEIRGVLIVKFRGDNNVKSVLRNTKGAA